MSADLELGPAERRAREAARELGRAAAPPPEHAFRERLARDFATGRIGEHRALQFGSPGGRRAAWRWALAPVLAVLAVVATILVDRTPGWQVAELSGPGIVRIDGAPVHDPGDLARRIRPGARLRTPDGVTLRLASAGFGMIEITPGAEVTLPATPGRWFEREVRATIHGGVVRFSTAPAFHGARLAVETPEASVQVTGTTFAVLAMPVGTCVCVLEGRVAVGARGGAMAMVESGRRREVFNTGAPPLMDAMLPDQTAPLRALRDECSRRMPQH